MKLTMATLWSPALLVAFTVIAAAAETQNRPTRFWNLTKNTISELRLAPAGTTNWGPEPPTATTTRRSIRTNILLLSGSGSKPRTRTEMAASVRLNSVLRQAAACCGF